MRLLDSSIFIVRLAICSLFVLTTFVVDGNKNEMDLVLVISSRAYLGRGTKPWPRGTIPTDTGGLANLVEKFARAIAGRPSTINAAILNTYLDGDKDQLKVLIGFGRNEYAIKKSLDNMAPIDIHPSTKGGYNPALLGRDVFNASIAGDRPYLKNVFLLVSMGSTEADNYLDSDDISSTKFPGVHFRIFVHDFTDINAVANYSGPSTLPPTIGIRLDAALDQFFVDVDKIMDSCVGLVDYVRDEASCFYHLIMRNGVVVGRPCESDHSYTRKKNGTWNELCTEGYYNREDDCKEGECDRKCNEIVSWGACKCSDGRGEQTMVQNKNTRPRRVYQNCPSISSRSRSCSCSTDKPPTKLSSGAVFGIVAGVIVGLILLIAGISLGVLYYMSRRDRARRLHRGGRPSHESKDKKKPGDGGGGKKPSPNRARNAVDSRGGGGRRSIGTNSAKQQRGRGNSRSGAQQSRGRR